MCDLQRKLVSVKAAGDATLKIKSVIRFSAEVSGDKKKADFAVLSKQSNKMIFNTALIDRKIDRIKTNSRQIIRKRGHVVPIIKSLEDKDAVQFSNDITT